MPAPKRPSSYDRFANLFKVPLRVQGANGPGGYGDADLESWMEGVVEAVFPHLPHRPDPPQFQENLAEVTAASMRPSPYGGGSVAFSGGFGAMPGGGGWPPGGGSPNGASGGPIYPYGSGGPQVGTATAWGAAGLWPTTMSTNGTGAGAPLGTADLTGPFATLASLANALEQNALPAAREIGPVTQDADLDRIEAERAVVLENLTSLIAELRQPAPDGPDRSVALSLASRLLSHTGELGFAAEILANAGIPITRTTNAVTPTDFANVSRLDVLLEWALAADAAVTAFNPAVVDARATVAIVKQLLGVITEKTRELELELDFADFGPLERARFDVTVSATQEITVARLFEWLQDQAGRQLPRLLDTSGALAKDTVVNTLTDQQTFVATIAALAGPTDFPWTYPIVDRLLDELLRYLTDAITEATTL
jgi:hypothetical protein